MKRMTKPRRLFKICSLLMSSIFAYSASVQLNDPDWYFWFPLYACACIVNLVNCTISSQTKIIYTAKSTILLGTSLFIKVAIEDLAVFFSLDLTERVIREKIGSGLVVISMILHLKASSRPRHHKQMLRFVDYGMAVLVGFAIGLPFVFFVLQKRELKFDQSN